jgi:hypothetical protein
MTFWSGLMLLPGIEPCSQPVGFWVLTYLQHCIYILIYGYTGLAERVVYFVPNVYGCTIGLVLVQPQAVSLSHVTVMAVVWVCCSCTLAFVANLFPTMNNWYMRTFLSLLVFWEMDCDGKSLWIGWIPQCPQISLFPNSCLKNNIEFCFFFSNGAHG